MHRAWLLVAPLLLAGCLETGQVQGIEQVTVEVRNEGNVRVPVDLSVRAPDGRLVMEERVHVGATPVTRAFPMEQPGTYVAAMEYDHEHTRNSGSSTATQHGSGSREHHLRHDDCDTAQATIVFRFTFQASGSGSRLEGPTSWGECA